MQRAIVTLLLLAYFSDVLFANLLKMEKEKYYAKGVAVVIIDIKSKSSFILREESSEKGAVKKLTQDYLFEPGNAMIPISFALLLDKDSKWSHAKVIDCRDVDLKKDDCKEAYAKDAIIYSSSKIMDMVSPSLKGEELYDGLKKLGFSHLPSKAKLKQNIYKTVCARGYGIRTNLLELTEAYYALLNADRDIREKTAKEMQKLLVEAVEKGTGKNAQVKGMLVGGKTGTAHIIDKKTKRYSNHYNDVFVGFANAKEHRYVIGVLVIDPKTKKLASDTAAYVFKDVVKSLIDKAKNDPYELAKKAYKRGDVKKTIQFLNKSCNSGNSLACYNLATMYEAGNDLKQDFLQAKKYYQKSCKLGFELACQIYN